MKCCQGNGTIWPCRLWWAAGGIVSINGWQRLQRWVFGGQNLGQGSIWNAFRHSQHDQGCVLRSGSMGCFGCMIFCMIFIGFRLYISLFISFTIELIRSPQSLLDIQGNMRSTTHYDTAIRQTLQFGDANHQDIPAMTSQGHLRCRRR